jgi:hypothetical protein
LLVVELRIWSLVCTLVVVVSVVVASVLMVVLHLLWHWWKSDSLWKVWKWVDELSSLLLRVIERAALAELAFSFVEEVLAWLSLVVRVDSSESSLSKVLRKRLKI